MADTLSNLYDKQIVGTDLNAAQFKVISGKVGDGRSAPSDGVVHREHPKPKRSGIGLIEGKCLLRRRNSRTARSDRPLPSIIQAGRAFVGNSVGQHSLSERAQGSSEVARRSGTAGGGPACPACHALARRATAGGVGGTGSIAVRSRFCRFGLSWR